MDAADTKTHSDRRDGPEPFTAPFEYLGSERAFRLGPTTIDGDHIAGQMPSGRWLRDRNGRPVAGALGVLVDDILGFAIIRHHPADTWSVSSEITIDPVGSLDDAFASGSLHAATSGPLIIDARGGHAAGDVVDDEGNLVAVCTQRGRWVPLTGGPVVTSAPTVEPNLSCIEDLLGADPEPTPDGAALAFAVGPVLVNPLANLHGGIAIVASDLVAAAVRTPWPTPWTTESLRINYLRPIPADSIVTFSATAQHVGRTRALIEVVGTVDGRACTLAVIAGRPAA